MGGETSPSHVNRPILSYSYVCHIYSTRTLPPTTTNLKTGAEERKQEQGWTIQGPSRRTLVPPKGKTKPPIQLEKYPYHNREHPTAHSHLILSPSIRTAQWQVMNPHSSRKQLRSDKSWRRGGEGYSAICYHTNFIFARGRGGWK